MANSKKPSIYSDRGSIGSAEELDEYGVWVKGEPQDLSSDNSGINKIDEISSDFDEVSSADSGDSLNFDDAVLDVGETSGISSNIDIEFPDDNIGIDGKEDSAFSMDDDFEDLTIEDESSAVTENNIEIEDTSFDEFEVPSVVESESAKESSEEFSGDEFNIADTSGGIELIDFDIEEDSGGDEKIGMESADLGFVSGSGADEQIEIETEDFNIDDGSKSDEEISIDLEDFDVPTVKAIENDINIQDNSDEASGEKESSLSTHLLMKIANELSSIRGELSELKKEFSIIRTVPVSEGEKGSFFNEEEDETIALTGDELDNIINTTDEGAPQEDKGGIIGGGDDDEDEAIALTGDELDNILNSADFIEESGTTEAPESEFPDEAAEETEEETDADFSDNGDLDGVDLTADFYTGADSAESSDVDIEAVPGNISSEEDATEEVTLVDDFAEDDFFDTSSGADLTEEITSEKTETEEETAGSELDDIEADGTEQSEDLSSLDDLSFNDTSLDDLSLDDLSLDDVSVDASSLEVPSVDEISEEQALDEFSDTEIEFDESKDHEELEKLRNEGATPITFAPDNSSYLEEDDSIHSEPDLSNAVIDEPELSADSIDDNLEEPSLNEDDFDLDSLDDLTIDDADLSFDTAAEEHETTLEEEIDSLNIDIPVENDTVVEEQTEIKEETPEEETVSFDDGLSDLSTSGFDDFDISEDEQPVIDEVPVIEEEPVIDEEPVIEEEPVIDEEPIIEEEPVIVEEPAIEEEPEIKEQPAPVIVQAAPAVKAVPAAPLFGKDPMQIPSELKKELRNILSYMDQLLESLPEEKIEEFARSEYFDSYKKLFKDLGLV